MHKRIRMDLILTEKDYAGKEFTDLLGKLEAFAKGKGQIIKAGKENEEKSNLKEHDCNHDIGKPCSEERDLLKKEGV